MMIIAILKGLAWTAVTTTVGRVVLGSALVFGLWQANNYYQRSLGAKAAVEKSIKAGKQANAANRKVRRKASKPGATVRVIRKYCRDCD